jgi:hypothetical protein
MMAREMAEGVLDLHVPLDQASELERPEVNVPDSVVDFRTLTQSAEPPYT